MTSNADNDNVVILDLLTRHNIPASRVLNAAIEQGVDSVIIAGYDKDANEYFASSLADSGDCLWLLERMKKALLERAD